MASSSDILIRTPLRWSPKIQDCRSFKDIRSYCSWVRRVGGASNSATSNLIWSNVRRTSIPRRPSSKSVLRGGGARLYPVDFFTVVLVFWDVWAVVVPLVRPWDDTANFSLVCPSWDVPIGVEVEVSGVFGTWGIAGLTTSPCSSSWRARRTSTSAGVRVEVSSNCAAEITFVTPRSRVGEISSCTGLLGSSVSD